MENKNHTDAVPENRSGDEVNTETVKECKNAAEANALYQTARGRLLDVNSWHRISGEHLAHFMLADQAGNPVAGPVQQGLMIRIDIPGPGTREGDGYDWVVVEEVKEETSEQVESVAVRVRPASDPTSDAEETAHFYAPKATSTFTVSRNHLTVSAGVYDRNLAPNQEADGLLDKIRNAIVGFMGENALSAVQWKAFTDGLLVS
ncbi:hypothetical protein [Dyadobacter sp. Leaf189]|uniref:hypothetical protein n=1 Tax=Dyadobacter sp. Leaf189 TaxID=1736295 RepID=UPI0006FB6191|nr:hypothetical protein [Dyadobacter sp. Leaf189]KQS30953.1 hypothetical protein ASG33_11355 [Dyadobacter sp. Leaf189]